MRASAPLWFRKWLIFIGTVLTSSAVIVGCGGDSSSTPEPAGVGAPGEPGASPAATQREARRAIREGGTLKLNTPGGSVDVSVAEALYVNTDEGYPDYVEVSGDGMYFIAQVAGKVEEDDQERLQYRALVGRMLPVQPMEPGNGEPMTIEIPGSGPYTIGGGGMTLEKFEHGPSTIDRWEGRLDLTLQTTQGPVSITGTFSFGIVPVW